MSKGKLDICIWVGYLLLCIPICMALFYAVPMSDDFANGAYNKAGNVIGDAVGWANWHYVNWSGRWLTYFFQKMINPLNAHVHLGHIYGLFMIGIFLACILVIKVVLDIIVTGFCSDNKSVEKFITFIIITILLSTNYYSEAYNWFVGATAYSVPMTLMLLTVALLYKYFSEGDFDNRKLYVGIILAGTYPAVNEMFDIPLGLIYIYIYIYHGVYCTLQRIKKEYGSKYCTAPDFYYIGYIKCLCTRKFG